MDKSQAKLKSRNEIYKPSRPRRPNPIPASETAKTGKIFTGATLVKTPFTALFAVCPIYPFKNKHCFDTMLCQKKVKMATQGKSDLRRNFEQDHHLRPDHRYGEKVSIAQSFVKIPRVLYDEKLEESRKKYLKFDVPELDHQRPYYYDVVEGKPIAFTSESVKTRIQIHLFITSLRSGAEIWSLEENWTQVGMLTGNFASTSDFSRSPEPIS